MIEKNYRKTVGIFGGTGFIGEEIVQHLVKNGFKIKIATRNVYLAQNLKVYGDIAQIELHQVNLKSEELSPVNALTFIPPASTKPS